MATKKSMKELRAETDVLIDAVASANFEYGSESTEAAGRKSSETIKEMHAYIMRLHARIARLERIIAKSKTI